MDFHLQGNEELNSVPGRTVSEVLFLAIETDETSFQVSLHNGDVPLHSLDEGTVLAIEMVKLFSFSVENVFKYLFIFKMLVSRQRVISNRHFQAGRCADLAQVGKCLEQENPR